MADKIVLMTPKVRLAFTQQLFTPKSFKGGKGKYGCSLLFDAAAQATPQYKALVHAAMECAEEKWGQKKLKEMSLRNPFLDGDKPEYAKNAGFAGTKFLRVSTEFKPGFATKAGEDMNFDECEEAFSSGNYARATLNPFAYDQDGNRGVSFGLRNLQYMGKGDSLGGRNSAAADFTPVDDDGGDVEDDFFGGGK